MNRVHSKGLSAKAARHNSVGSRRQYVAVAQSRDTQLMQVNRNAFLALTFLWVVLAAFLAKSDVFGGLSGGLALGS